MTTHTSSAPPLAATLEQGLQEHFGFETFRPGQRDVMEAVVGGTNALVVMPTGSGKSLCFQLPALVLDGITLVISPLIALMKDQVDALQTMGIPATFINSSISTTEQRDRIYGMEMGQYKLVYVAPERFRSNAFCDALLNTRISLLAIDEAHCISQWGHDFRPDYLTISSIRKRFNAPTTIALTATATRQVQNDILAQLELPEADVFVYGFERPNLFLEVHDTRSKVEKLDRTEALLNHHRGESSLVYCATRKQVEEVSDALRKKGFAVGSYHGGLSDSARERVQDEFMSDDANILVATNAFGMGVDKPDIRAIVHYNMPGSLEAYYQEAGRAGRDGEESHCLLLFNYADRGIHEFFIDQTYPTRETIEAVWEHLTRAGLGTHYMDAQLLTDQLNRSRRSKRLNSWGVESALRLLKRGGHADFGQRDGHPWITVQDQARLRDMRVDWEYVSGRRQVNLGLLTDVIRYASGRSCRQLYLLRYFNSRPSFTGGCGHCEVCQPETAYGGNSTPAVAGLRIPSEDEPLIVIKKILSGVARTRGRWGAHVVAGMLRGSRSKRVLSAGLDRLSTYGLFAKVKQQDLVTLLDLFSRHELLQRDEHGCVGLSPHGKDVMLGAAEAPFALLDLLEDAIVQPRGRTRRRRSTASSSTSDSASSGSASANKNSGEKGAEENTYTETLTMLHEGMSPAEIAEARELSLQSVLRHMMVLSDDGHRYDISSLLNEELLLGVRQAAEGWSYGEAMAPIKRKAPDCTYDELKLHLAQVLMERAEQ